MTFGTAAPNVRSNAMPCNMVPSQRSWTVEACCLVRRVRFAVIASRPLRLALLKSKTHDGAKKAEVIVNYMSASCRNKSQKSLAALRIILRGSLCRSLNNLAKGEEKWGSDEHLGKDVGKDGKAADGTGGERPQEDEFRHVILGARTPQV